MTGSDLYRRLMKLDSDASSSSTADVFNGLPQYKPLQLLSFDWLSKPTPSDCLSTKAGLAPIPSCNKLAVADYGRERVSCISSYSVDDQPSGLFGVGGYRQLRKPTDASYNLIVIERLHVTATYYWD